MQKARNCFAAILIFTSVIFFSIDLLTEAADFENDEVRLQNYLFELCDWLNDPDFYKRCLRVKVYLTNIDIAGTDGIDIEFSKIVIGKMTAENLKVILAHELGHILLYHSSRLRASGWDMNIWLEIEIEADRFAAALISPQDVINTLKLATKLAGGFLKPDGIVRIEMLEKLLAPTQ